MPILDHFRAPLFPTHRWESFHSRWANAIADSLDQRLPRRFFAEVNTHLGSQVATDVAEFEQKIQPPDPTRNGSSGGVAVQTWALPTVTMTLPFTFLDELEVRILDERDGARLVAVIELVSPSNKDRPAACQQFAAKCVAYLQCGIGVIVVDIVTTRQANLHNAIVDLLQLDDTFRMTDSSLIATAYAPAHRDDRDQIDVWSHGLEVGDTLPVLPLALRGIGPIPLDLEATYMDARRRCRL